MDGGKKIVRGTGSTMVLRRDDILQPTIDEQGRILLPSFCPLCEEEEPEIEAWQHLNASRPITLGDGTASWSDELFEDYDNIDTEHYMWACCGHPLPENVQRALDAQLSNRRVQIEVRD